MSKYTDLDSEEQEIIDKYGDVEDGSNVENQPGYNIEDAARND